MGIAASGFLNALAILRYCTSADVTIMTEQTSKLAPEPKANEPKENKGIKAVVFWVRELFAGCLWLGLFIKGFVVDFDLLVVKESALLTKVYPYKFFILLGFLAISWAVLGTKRFLKTVGYVLIYPFIFFLWRIPKQLFKNWALLVIFAPAIESAFFTLKWRFAFVTIAILAALAILIFSQPAILGFSMWVLMAYLLVHYVLRLKVAFRPTAIFASLADRVEEMWRYSITTYKKKDYDSHTGAGPQGEAYEKKRVENLKELYMQILMWTFLASKLDKTISSRRTDLYFILAVFYSFLITVVIFAFEFFALAKVSPNSFTGPGNVSIWSYLVFSFNTIMHTGFTRIVPVSDWAFALANVELLAGVITLVFFVYVLMTSSKERYREDFRRVVTGLDQSSKEIERFLEKKLKMRLVDAEAKIVAHDPKFRDTIRSFGRSPVVLDAEIVSPTSEGTVDK